MEHHAKKRMIRTGLIGFGMGGRVFHAPLLASVEGLELAAVVERHSNHAAQRYPGIATYRTVEAMLEDDSLGLFVVATPSGSHFSIAHQLLDAGKNVVVDKPMACTSGEIATLIRVAAAKKVLLAPFHNCRWDSDYLTVRKLLDDRTLGRLVYFESNMDRWRPQTRAAWKENPAMGGGVLLDLGTHLADQALVLFGPPLAVWGEVRRERDGEGADDSFTMRLRYPGFTVSLSSNCLSSLPRPRFRLRGSKGNYSAAGSDPQEAALNTIVRIDSATWGEVSPANWGTLRVDAEGAMVSRPVPSIPGDYRLYYAGIRDALLRSASAPVNSIDAWRVARILEYARVSSDQRREIPCDWAEAG